MRISDWSSDVCSSDLFAEVDELAASAIGVEQRQRDAGARAFADLDLAAAVIHEIGRASCRERVCQCVDLGGRRIIKKKKSTRICDKATYRTPRDTKIKSSSYTRDSRAN